MDDNLQALRDAHSYALDWFKLHAEQRMRLFNFFLVLLSAFIAGFGTAATFNITLAEIAGGITLVTLAFVFRQLDRRVSELIKYSEKALCQTEAKLADLTGLDSIRIAKAADQKNGTYSFRTAFIILFYLAMAIGTMMVAHGVWVLWQAHLMT